MLTRWTVSNFKSIREPVALDFAPLTVFAGPNSSGKSTFIQSILLVAQSFISEIGGQPLVLNGQFVQLGRFEDVLHHGAHDVEMNIGFELLPATVGKLAVIVEASLEALPPVRSRSRQAERLVPRVKRARVRFVRHEARLRGSRFELEVRGIPGADMTPLIKQMTLDLQDQVKTGVYDFALVQPDGVQLVTNSSLEQVERIGMLGLVPWRLLLKIDSQLRQLIDDIEWIMDTLAKYEEIGELPRLGPYSQELSPLVPAVFKTVRLPVRRPPQPDDRRRWDNRRPKSDDISEFHHNVVREKPQPIRRNNIVQWLEEGNYHYTAVGDLRRRLASALSDYVRRYQIRTGQSGVYEPQVQLFPGEYNEALDQVRQTMKEQIFYLGPIRDSPRVMYGTPTSSTRRSVGLRGEYTAAMLDEYRNLEVSYPAPPTSFTGEVELKRGPLIEALTAWLKHMRLLESIDTEETPKVGYRLTVGSEGVRAPLDLLSVGVGVSQVLPTLVLALLAPEDSTLILEQPELHLHPRAQSILGDFLLGITQTKKQCIVETHSEHLVNRLRRRIVEAPGDTVLRNVAIYFADREQMESRFRRVEPNEYGAILEWPKGFFDEAEEEATVILRRQMEKRRDARLRMREEEGGQP